jgi:hypothetical protein
MQFTYLSLVGALVMLILGLIDYALLRAALYRPLRWRYEAGKARGRAGVEPNVVMGVVKFVNLLVFPVLGLLFGDQVLKGLM